MSTMLAKLTRTTLALGGRCLGYLPVLRRLRSRQVAVVMYHGVTASPLPAENWCQLDASEFARQVEYLARHYTLLPLSEVIDRLAQDRPLPRSPAVLTFDDGFRNVLTTALPVLERHQAPDTVFLVTGLMGTRQPAWPDRLFHAVVSSRRERVSLPGRGEWPLATPAQRTAAHRALASHLKALPEDQKQRSLAALLGELGAAEVPADSPLATLDWEEVERLRHTGLIEFGSHTHTHPILSRCSPEQQREELRLSRDVLRERLGRCDLFAYPNGCRADFTAETQRLLAELGYRCAVSTMPGLNDGRTDRYALRRVNVGADTTLAQFRLLMLGQ